MNRAERTLINPSELSRANGDTAALATSGAELALVPLHPRHAADWFRHSLDEHVATMTQLPRLDTIAAVSAWIAERWQDTLLSSATSRLTFAIVAPADHFLGSVSLLRAGNAAFFSFWVAAEFQRRGIGTRAAVVANDVAAHLGFTNLFAASFRDNTASHRVLLRTGWRQLPFLGKPPSNGLVFFHRSVRGKATQEGAVLHGEFERLLRAVDSDFELEHFISATTIY